MFLNERLNQHFPPKKTMEKTSHVKIFYLHLYHVPKMFSKPTFYWVTKRAVWTYVRYTV